MTLYVTANGPGEISGFLAPLAAALRRSIPDARVIVILLPCAFATGREEAVARAIPGVYDVIPARRVWFLVVRGLPVRGDAIVHLGGDLMYAALLAWRWRIPSWAVQWAQHRWDRWFRGYFVRTEADRARLREQGISPERVHVIGDMVFDAVHLALRDDAARPHATGRLPQAADAPTSSEPHIAFLPGSRDVEVVGLTPFFLEVAEHLRALWPGARFSLLLSPYVQWERIRDSLEHKPDPQTGGVQGTLVRENGENGGNGTWSLVTSGGARLSIVTEDTPTLLARSDFVVTIPGTKTAEAGSLAKPMLVIIPINRMEQIPWHGLLGLLDWLPLVGRQVKRLIMSTMIESYIGRVYALPNLLATSLDKCAVVPEIMGFLSPMLVADKVLEVFGCHPPGRDSLPLRGRVQGPLGPYSHNGAVQSTVTDMQKDLLALYAPHAGAADRLVAAILASPE